MKRLFPIFVIVGTFLSTGCGKKNNSSEGGRPDSPAPSGPSEAITDVKFEMPKVKYPAAIVFEGGQGYPLLDQDGSKHTPVWRLYICLEKTTGSNKGKGKVELDFTTLGSPFHNTVWKMDKLEVIFKDQLNKVVLDYEYELELSDTPDTNDGYADARLTFNSKATLNWKEIEINGPYNPNFFRENLPDTKEFFEVQFNPHANIFNQKVYNRDGETRYFLNWQERFTFSEQDRESHIIEACEKGNSPIVWLFDDDIRKLNNQ